MKKTLCILLALIMTLTALTACGGKNAQAPQLYKELTGIDPDEVAMVIDDHEITAEMYLYWVLFNCSAVEQQIMMMNAYYGLYEDLVDPVTHKVVWDGRISKDQTVKEYAIAMTEDTVKFMIAVEDAAKENGVVITKEDEAAFADTKAQIFEKVGGEEGYNEYLDTLGIREENFRRVNEVNYLLEGLKTLAAQEGSALYLEPAGYDEYAAYADHILISTRDESGMPLVNEDREAKRALAEKTLEELRAAGDDLEAVFVEKADALSEDPGRAAAPDGYIFSEGEMVKPFEEAAFALKPGEISEIVESDYGFHIILRKDLQEGLAAHPEKKEQILAKYVDDLLSERMEKMKTTFTSTLEGLDVEAFFNKYVEHLDAVAAEQEAKKAENAPEDKADTAEPAPEGQTDAAPEAAPQDDAKAEN